MKDVPTRSQALHELKEKYKADNHIDSLVQQMAQFYEDHALPIDLLSGRKDQAITSVLPPEKQTEFEELKNQLEAYQQTHYALLFKKRKKHSKEL